MYKISMIKNYTEYMVFIRDGTKVEGYGWYVSAPDGLLLKKGFKSLGEAMEWAAAILPPQE